MEKTTPTPHLGLRKPSSESLKKSALVVGKLKPPNSEPLKTKTSLKRSMATTPNIGAKRVNIDFEKLKVKRELEEKLRRMKLAKKLAGKTSISELKDDIAMWRSGCQEALTHLNELINDRNLTEISLAELIEKLGVDVKLIHFDKENESFYN